MIKLFIQLSFLIISVTNSPALFAKEAGNDWKNLFPNVPSISQAEMEAKRNELVLVDVRAKYSFDKQHKEGAKNISFSSRMFMIAIENLIEKNKGKTIVFYCESNNCIKSYLAVEKCLKADLKNIVIFDRNEVVAKNKQQAVYTQLNLQKL